MVRVRFAPSPTGHLHIGGLRTTIFNLLFARHNNGKFLLRIEDTDLERSKKEYVDSILDSLNWMSITSDEPLFYQSQRFDIYKKVADKLLAEGKAYKCFCSEESIKNRLGEFNKYDGFCRDKQDQTGPYVIRFKLPDTQGAIEFDDLIRGRITVGLDQLDDFIFVRSDGVPVYNFVVVIDDAAMNITHVIRGEEHISNTPKQILIYNACGYKMPLFAHIPLILGTDGSKLSKRDADVSVLDYKKKGYLADALFNYLVRLGWSHGDQEIFTKEEVIKYFTLENVGKKGAIFDIQKLNWVNGMYMRNSKSDELLNKILSDVEPLFLDKNWNREQVVFLIDLYKQRANNLSEIVGEVDKLYKAPIDYVDIDKWINDKTSGYLDSISKELEAMEFTSEKLHAWAKDFCSRLNIKLVEIAQPLRIALTGKTTSPGVFELLSIIGKEESLKRIKLLQKFLEKRECA